ncbi:radical SAM protein [Treponema sp.]|uniref:radical SAM protein n=1 Tax=Treponema sp. TaxID=166 RepID=UPI00298D7115|nr:radical SAM protein [Treponema sp.]MCQ2241603.1 4Fe-4S cluster-binding domain-containing protein [Treponema sp.]
MKKNGPGFNPEEIIFCPTSLCNLKCAHCFVEQKNSRLELKDALELLEDCAKNIELLKVGFSGGEPFLNLDFTTEICRKSIDLGLVFDRLMTNGVWWNDSKELEKRLTAVFDSGFDGKIGLSFDSFHGQDVEKISQFIKTCHKTFNDRSCVEILSVVDAADVKKDTEKFLLQIDELKNDIGFSKSAVKLNRKNGSGSILLYDDEGSELTIFRFTQSFIPDESIRLNDGRWFSEDYCQYTGNVLYVHSDGNIAPCCGFANEKKELFIGTVKDNFKTLMENALQNPMVDVCYNYGLLQKAKEMQKEKLLPKGKCNDMCSLCYWMCGKE